MAKTWEILNWVVLLEVATPLRSIAIDDFASSMVETVLEEALVVVILGDRSTVAVQQAILNLTLVQACLEISAYKGGICTIIDDLALHEPRLSLEENGSAQASLIDTTLIEELELLRLNLLG